MVICWSQTQKPNRTSKNSHEYTGLSSFWMYAHVKWGNRYKQIFPHRWSSPWVPIRCEQDPHSMRNMLGLARLDEPSLPSIFGLSMVVNKKPWLLDMHEPIISILAHTLCSENTCLRFKHQLYWHILRSSWSFFFCLTQFNATHETNATQCKSMQLNATHPLQRNLTQLFTYCSVIPLFQDVHVTAFLVLNASSCMSLWEFRSPCSASRIPPRIIDISCNRSTLAASLSPLPSFVAHFYCLPPPLLARKINHRDTASVKQARKKEIHRGVQKCRRPIREEECFTKLANNT